MTSELLSPAEAALLYEPSSFSGGKCLQAALLSLLDKGHVELGEEGRFFKHKTLRVRDGDGEALPPHLAAVKHVLMAEGRHRVLKAQEVASALQRSFGNGFRQYIHDKVGPALITRGLLRREDRKWLGLVPYKKYLVTNAGAARAAKLIELMDQLSDMKRLIRDDPDRALQLARAAGVLLVLSPAARAQADNLKELMHRRDEGGSAGDGGGGTATYEDDSGWGLEVDISNFSFASDMFGMLDGIDAAGDFTGDGGDDGGGDGGGGGD